MRIVRSFTALGLVSLSLGCSTADSDRTGSRPVSRAPGNSEIMTLRVRHGMIEIRTGAEGRSFTVLDGDGGVVAANLSEEELRSQFPAHSEAMRTGLAGPETSPPLDARVYDIFKHGDYAGSESFTIERR